MGQNVEDAFDAQRIADVDTRDAAFGDGRGDDGAVGHALAIEFAGILCRAGDLSMAVDAGCGRANIGHEVHRTFLSDCDCGVPCAACVSARTMARRARSILKALWANALAS